MFSKTALATLACAAAVWAHPASPLAIATVKQQFVNALLVPAVIPVFNPVALLEVNFPAVGEIENGQVVTKDNAGAKPTVTAVGTDAAFAAGGAFNTTTTKYTIIMVDGNTPGSAEKQPNVHYLENNLSFGSVADEEVSFTSAATPAVIRYAGPGPAAGSGPHRYTMLLFAQPATFTAPATPAAGSSVTRVDIPAYISAAGLGSPLAGVYFTVEVGTATVAFSTTAPVNTATLSVAAASSGSAASASSTAAATNAAIAKGANGLVAGVMAVAMGLALA